MQLKLDDKTLFLTIDWQKHKYAFNQLCHIKITIGKWRPDFDCKGRFDTIFYMRCNLSDCWWNPFGGGCSIPLTATEYLTVDSDMGLPKLPFFFVHLLGLIPRGWMTDTSFAFMLLFLHWWKSNCTIVCIKHKQMIFLVNEIIISYPKQI